MIPPPDRTITVDGERAAKRYVPASTFKIANSLIALETGVVKDESEVIPYGGKPQPFKAWEKDMSMREAIAASTVPIYQEIARRVGLERYRDWLERLGYGNRRTGTALERFWLDGPLEISAVEQARFVAALAQQKLPASIRSQSIVRDILRLELSGDPTLYGKTGWRSSSTPSSAGGPAGSSAAPGPLRSRSISTRPRRRMPPSASPSERPCFRSLKCSEQPDEP